MPTLRLSIKWIAKPFLLFLLFAFNNCYAQLNTVNELQAKLKQNMPDTARLTLLQKLATAYSSVDPEKKFYYANVFKTLATKLNNHEAVADSYIQMGISYGIRSKIDSALYYFNLAYNQANKHGFDLVAGRCLANIGFAYTRLDDSREAVKYYFQALEIYKKIKYDAGANQCYTNIGSIYYDMNKVEIARSYFVQALAGHTKSKKEIGIAGALYSIGNCHLALDQYNQAIDYYNRSLEIRQKLGDFSGVGLAKMGLGRVYIKQKKYDDALVSLDTALSKIQTVGDKYVEANVLISISNAYSGKKDYNSAIKYAKQALDISRSIKSKSVSYDAMDKLVSAYKNKGDIKNALYYQTEYVLTKDSIQEEKVLKDISLMEISRVRSENANLEKSNENISNQNSNYLAKINKFSTIILATTLILASTILLSWILYRLNQNKQAVNKQLIKQKEEIALINQELAMLNEEINTQMELSNTQNIELEKLNDIKNKFFSIISHDLRGPLSTLQTLLEIYREGDIGEKEFRDLLIRLEDTILTTGSFLDNLLEWSKNQLEGIQVNSVLFNISDTVNENIHLFETKIGLKNLKVKNTTDNNVMAFADPNMISLVIRNLLSNSIKFCNPGDEIILEAKNVDNRTIISISDTGPGIKEQDADKLFSLDHVLSTGSQGEKGNHLGLILCKEMIVQNNGKLWFETQLGTGTTFWFDLPTDNS